MIKEDLKTRFLKKILIDDKTGCWNWTASGRGVGYGCLKIEGKVVDSHRVSWMLYRGDIPENMLVCHKCDNRKCVNPDHLFLGTYLDNNRDMFAKGRNINTLKNHPELAARGEKSSGSKLTTEDVLDILCFYYIKKIKAKNIVGMYYVGRTAIYDILAQRTWKEVSDNFIKGKNFSMLGRQQQ